jgi:hypothetical protein
MWTPGGGEGGLLEKALMGGSAINGIDICWVASEIDHGNERVWAREETECRILTDIERRHSAIT